MGSWYHGALTRAFALLVPIGLVACGSSPGPEPGHAGPPVAASSRQAKQPKPQKWSGIDGIAALARLGEYTSQGHAAGRYTATLKANPIAAEPYSQLVAGRALPAGSLLVQELREADSDDVGPLYVMEKKAQGWRFLVVSRDGWIQPERTDLCARCHADAPVDSVFGLPNRAGLTP